MLRKVHRIRPSLPAVNCLSIFYTHDRRASNFDHAKIKLPPFAKATGLLLMSQQKSQRHQRCWIPPDTTAPKPMLAQRRFVHYSSKMAEHSSRYGELNGWANACCSVNRVDIQQHGPVRKPCFLGVILCEFVTRSRRAGPLLRSS